jgi:hypothetical protein
MIEIVSATRLRESDFWEKSALGLSLRRLAHDTRLVPRIAFENTRGLPEIFNARILSRDPAEILIFIHDDVWIDDYFLGDRVAEGCAAFDVIGVAGNLRRVSDQPSWAFVDTKLTWDQERNLSGSVAHGPHPFGAVRVYGPAPAKCKLLDGVFLAAKKQSLVRKKVLFDPLFDFHFYDMDFCRSASERGVRLGTWPICLTHQSVGVFGDPKWNEKYSLYLKKWGT